MYTELTEDKLGELLQSNKQVMVQYGASWCGNCKITKPKFKRLAESNPNVAFYYVDAEKLPGTRQYAEVSNLPTFAGFQDGKLVMQQQGNKLETIEEVVNALTSN